jgi:copper oxidase (laccase) domain-containing protein
VVGLIERSTHGIHVLSFESFGALAGVDAVVTTRHGGESTGPFATLNLGMRTGDDAEVVRRNRSRAASVVGAAPAWLTSGQVHGARGRWPNAEGLDDTTRW